MIIENKKILEKSSMTFSRGTLAKNLASVNYNAYIKHG